MAKSMTKPNFNFELGLDDIELIERSLGDQIKELSKKHWTHPNESNQHLEKIKEIHELLGRIHNQKIWYRPQKNYVGG